MVFRPDYRGHGFSEGAARGAYGFPDYTVDVLNGLAAVKQHPDVDPNRIGMWGHSMGGGITLRVLAVMPEQIGAAVLYGSMSGDEAKNYGRSRGWTNNSRGRFELDAPPDTLRAISPIMRCKPGSSNRSAVPWNASFITLVRPGRSRPGTQPQRLIT